MNKRWLPAALLALVLLAFSCTSPADGPDRDTPIPADSAATVASTQAPTPTLETATPTATPSPPPPTETPLVSAQCQAETSAYLARIRPLIAEWKDTFDVAIATSRIALAQPIQEMQRIRRDIAAVSAPQCAQNGATLIVTGLDNLIAEFIDFMGGASMNDVEPRMVLALDLIATGSDELIALASGQLPPTSTPTTAAPTPGPPTATTSPVPTSLPTEPPVGTRANPVPRGQSRQAPDGWQITVLDFNPHAWPVVLAENQFNDPPAPGNRMVIVRVAVTNAAAQDEPAWISEAGFYLVGSHNVSYSTFGGQSSCGVIPDDLAEELFRGGTAEGNVCFQIPDDEIDLRLLYEYAWDEFLFFAVE